MARVAAALAVVMIAGVGHNVFMWAYTEPALIDWLFAQKR